MSQDLTHSMNQFSELGDWLGLIHHLANNKMDERYVCPPALLKTLSEQAWKTYAKAFDHLDKHSTSFAALMNY